MAEATRIDGKAFAERLRARIAEVVAGLAAKPGLVPGLAVVLVGDNPVSQIYVRSKARQTTETGMRSFAHRLPAAASQAELLALLRRLNGDPAVHGILVQLPLPPQIDPAAVLGAIDPAKDVDGFHPVNTGALWSGGLTGPRPPLVACTPLGCLMLLKHSLGELSGLKALVVGRSNIVGKPMAALLLGENCTVTLAHSRTRDLAAEYRRAEILVAAVGRPEMVRGDWIGPGATVIDVGINRVPAAEAGKTRLVGDIAYAEAAQVARAITPVPGGVGPMTIACLMRNTVVAACRQHGLADPDL